MAKADVIGLLLVRCGRTAWDEAGRLQGTTNLPVTDDGRAELIAALADQSLAALDPSAVMHAPDEASKESAEIVAEALGGKLKESGGIGAMDFGLWQGLLESELLERYRTPFQRWREDPASVNPPEGETFLDVELRMLAAMRKAFDKAGPRPIAVVLRPLPLALMRSWVLEEPTTRLWDLLEAAPHAEYHRVPRTLFRGILDDMKAKA